MHTLTRIAIDAVAVGVFAAVGRSSHQEAASVLGVVQTAAPFWLGTAAGWLVCRFGAPRTLLGEGITVWLSTVVVGHLVRVVLGPGTQLSFVIVSLLVLAVLLLGWRGIYALVTRARR